MQLSTSGPPGQGMKWSTWSLGSGGQRWRSHEAEVRFGRLAGLADISFSTTPRVE